MVSFRKANFLRGYNTAAQKFGVRKMFLAFIAYTVAKVYYLGYKWVGGGLFLEEMLVN